MLVSCSSLACETYLFLLYLGFFSAAVMIHEHEHECWTLFLLIQIVSLGSSILIVDKLIRDQNISSRVVLTYFGGTRVFLLTFSVVNLRSLFSSGEKTKTTLIRDPKTEKVTGWVVKQFELRAVTRS